MKLLSILAITATLGSGAVQAASLDFVAFGAGTYGPTISLPEATITNVSGGSILVGSSAAGVANGFCSLGGGGCEADTEISFTNVVSNLMFNLDGSNPGDSVLLSIYGVANAFLGSLAFTTPDQPVDLSAFGSITRLFFDDSSTGAGYGYSDFTFDQGPAAIPLPASLPLLAAGLGLLAAARRRRV